MNGLIIPDTPIAVDYWTIRNASTAKLFFLSHAHADHTSGLSSSWREPIYCSEITGRIIRHKFKIKAALVRPLEVNESHIIPLDDVGKETMTVTIIDANHCPGAVMFLFEGYFGNILYTGDFRYHPDMLKDVMLSRRKSIDILYLDNTYCDPRCSFPSREEAIEQAVEQIKQFPDHRVIIATTDIGKEELLITVAKKLTIPVCVPSTKYELYSSLELPNIFTTDPEVGGIHVLPRTQLTARVMKDMVSDKETIILVPTCLFIGLGNNPFDIENVFTIPFSDHSSFEELCDFVSKVKPKKIVPIVEYKKKVFGVDCSKRSDMRCFDRFLNPKPSSSTKVPKSVQQFMFSSNSLNVVRPSVLKRARAYTRSKQVSSKRLCRGIVYNSPGKSQEALEETVSGLETNDGDSKGSGDVESLRAENVGSVSASRPVQKDSVGSGAANLVQLNLNSASCSGAEEDDVGLPSGDSIPLLKQLGITTVSSEKIVVKNSTGSSKNSLPSGTFVHPAYLVTKKTGVVPAFPKVTPELLMLNGEHRNDSTNKVTSQESALSCSTSGSQLSVNNIDEQSKLYSDLDSANLSSDSIETRDETVVDVNDRNRRNGRLTKWKVASYFKMCANGSGNVESQDVSDLLDVSEVNERPRLTRKNMSRLIELSIPPGQSGVHFLP